MSDLEDLFARQLEQRGEVTFERQCKQPYQRSTLRNKRSQPRADFCWPIEKLVVELQGGVRSNGRHNRADGYIKDCVKHNNAVLDGWAVLWFTTDEIMRTEEALNTTIEALEVRRAQKS